MSAATRLRCLGHTEVEVRHWTGMILTMVVLGTMPAGAAKPGEQKKHPHEKPGPAAEHYDTGHTAAVHVAFGTADIQLVRQHYAPQYRNLPPGLQKKLARGGSLPPGWQKKMEPFPPTLERGLRPLPAGYSRGVFDGHAVIYDTRGMIVDVAVLF
jgi:hypothetical protein